MPIIYADFNGIQSPGRTSNLFAIPLDTYGSLRDLSNQGIRLVDGLSLTVYMDSAEQEDIEADVVVYFDETNKCWLAEGDRKLIREVPLHAFKDENVFLCFKCRNNLNTFFKENDRKEDTICPHCELSIMYSISPP